MALRSAKCYRKVKRPNTRVSKRTPRKSYVKGVPYPKIRSFESGKKSDSLKTRAYLVSGEEGNLRHNALEAARVAANKNLETAFPKQTYFMKVLVFPHHILRENPIATGAGADRYQTGMRLSFGRPSSTAARVKKNQRIIEVRVPEGRENIAKETLKTASSKFPIKCSVVFE